MSERRTERFDVEGPATLDVHLASGDVEVAAGAPDEVSVEIRGPDADRFEVAQVGGGTVVGRARARGVRWRSHRVLARVPDATALDAHLASAGLSVSTGLAALDVESASGDVAAQTVTGDCQVSTASGDVRLGRVGGALSARSASGDIAVAGTAGQARVQSASGDVRVGEADGDLEARTASGDVAVDRFGGGTLEVKTMSGDVRVGLPSGRSVGVELNTLSGAVRSGFEVAGDPGRAEPAEEDGRVEVRSVSGDIMLTAATPAAG